MIFNNACPGAWIFVERSRPMHFFPLLQVSFGENIQIFSSCDYCSFLDPVAQIRCLFFFRPYLFDYELRCDYTKINKKRYCVIRTCLSECLNIWRCLRLVGEWQTWAHWVTVAERMDGLFAFDFHTFIRSEALLHADIGFTTSERVEFAHHAIAVFVVVVGSFLQAIVVAEEWTGSGFTHLHVVIVQKETFAFTRREHHQRSQTGDKDQSAGLHFVRRKSNELLERCRSGVGCAVDASIYTDAEDDNSDLQWRIDDVLFSRVDLHMNTRGCVIHAYLIKFEALKSEV